MVRPSFREGDEIPSRAIIRVVPSRWLVEDEHRLNEDARFELFEAIAEFVDDGVFVLMGVCTEWQAQVLRLPRLRRYITTSDNLDDMEAKLDTQLVMSTGMMLVVRVHFLHISLRTLESALQRDIANLTVITVSCDQESDKAYSVLRKVFFMLII